jgi:ABC-type nitrate/sulfonate/bicarbonate transport system substrate-binding protein
MPGPRRNLWIDRWAIQSMWKLSSALTMCILIITACPGFLSCAAQAETVIIGMESTPVNSLIYIALHNNYFKENNINLVIKNNYASGAAAVHGMVSGETDLATATEFVIVRQVFAGRKPQVLAGIDKFMHQYLVWRKDLGIKGIGDLKHKTIGVPLNTQARFNLSRYLLLNNIDEKQIQIIDIQAPQAALALSAGRVDAVVTWQPFVAGITQRLGDIVEIRSIHNDQPAFCLVIAGKEWLGLHSGTAGRFLAALSRAEEFIINYETAAKTIIQTRLHYTSDYMNAIWPDHLFSLSLDQSLVVAMEDQSRWMIETRLTQVDYVPDFMEFIDEDNLIKIKPGAVNIIR